MSPTEFQLGKSSCDPHFLIVAVFKFRNLKSGQAVPIPPGEFTVGRAEDADVQVDDPSVSRHHARLISDDKGLFLEDLGSANGVAVHGAYVTGRTSVKLGDLVHIGKVPFRVDPEVSGDLLKSGALRRVDRASMQRPTEKIPIPALEDAPAAISFTPAMAEPAPEKEASKSGALIRHSVPLPALVRLIATPSAEPTSESAGGIGSASGDGSSHSEEPDLMPWWWWMVVFLAGLGSGLLLGLFFAKLFLDMGGRPSSLP